VTEINARSVLVVAPHFDDEVLGCGGLLSQVVAREGEVRVLFLADCAGGVEEIEDRPAYQSRRRQEAEAVVEHLGFAGATYLDLPDGELPGRLREIREALAEEILEHCPQVLLVPSPLEVTGDHRVAFAAVHDLLAPVRGEGSLAAAAADLEVLVYEVNHPFYPNLLVDVSDQLDRIRSAMALYASQQERHDYLAAGLGLRRYRTHSLGPEVDGAEGYVLLRLEDFTTRSPAQLVRHLGGEPELALVEQGPLVSVIVRTRDRHELLAQALASLAENTYRQVEVVLVNDGGATPTVAGDFPFPVVVVDLEKNRGRAGAANAGVQAASGAWISFLDDDDLAAPEHLGTLVGLAEAAGVRVAYTDAAVGVYELSDDGGWACVERRLPYSRDFDGDLLRLDNYIPFNTLIFETALLREVGGDGGLFDDALPFFEDWEMLIRLTEHSRFHHLAKVTCEYRHFRGGGHHIFGEDPRRRGDFLAVKAKILQRHGAALTPDLLARVVDTLRTEAVTQGEAAASRRREIAEVRRVLEGREDELFRTTGELASLKGDHGRLQSAFEETRKAFQAKADEEARLRAALAEQEERLQQAYAEITRLNGDVERLTSETQEHGEHLGRTYAEIQRLGKILEGMEQTRAWRVHQWLQAKRGGTA